MTTPNEGVTDDSEIDAVRTGTPPEFEQIVERHRRELRTHCYRLLGSAADAEDAVQDTYLNAWRARRTYSGRAPVRAWLYRIATNSCLQMLRHTTRKASPTPPPPPGSPATRVAPCSTVPWLSPIPDDLLGIAAPRDDEPDEVVALRDSVSLAFLTAIQMLAPRQRAVLLLRDVLMYSANESAELLDISVAAANSALQRARARLRTLHDVGAPQDGRGSSTAQRRLVSLYMRAHEQADPHAIVAILRDDARLSVSPQGLAWTSRAEITQPYVDNMNALGVWRCRAIRANGQPAVAHYLRATGTADFEAFSLVVLDIRGDSIVEIATFTDPDLFGLFGLPARLP